MGVAPGNPSPERLGNRQIFAFYWPLVLTSQMMTLAHPIINAALGRSDDAIVQLAGYGVGFGLAVFLNSPLFPFQHIVASMGVGNRARRDLIAKGLILGVFICAVDLAIALSPLGELLIGRAMGSTPPVTALARQIILVQAPIPLLLPLRSLAWGIVMRHRNTRIISQATGLRLALLSVVVFVFAGRGILPPAVIGGASMTLAILVETIYSGIRATRLARRNAAGINEQKDENVGWGAFAGFMGPLMVSTVTWSAMRPLLNAIVGRTVDPDLAQGGLGFVFPLVILMASPLWALQNTTLILVREREDFRRIMRFATVAIAVMVGVIGIWVWTPLRDILLTGIFSLDPDKAAYVAVAVMLIPYQPIPLGLRSVSQGFLMNRRRTGIVATASLTKTVLIIVLGLATVARYPGINGALLGTFLVIIGGSMETAIVATAARRLHHRLIDETDAVAGSGDRSP